MTQEEIRDLKEAKAAVSDRLSTLDIGGYRLEAVDERLYTYTFEVAAHPERHNLWEQLAVERFFRMIDRYGLDRVAVQKFFYFYEHLHFDGKGGLQCYRLTPVQAFQFASVYGFLHPDGRRVVKECVLFVPRKYSKTTSSAAFAIYDLMYGDHNAECYIGANSQDQAKKCFDVIRKAMRKLDNRGKRFVINEQVVKPTRKNPRAAQAQCLTANARTKDGMNASTVIMDEFSQARDSELLTVLTTSMGIREQPLTVIITTASDVFDGPFYAMLQGYKEVLLGNLEDDTLFAHLFEPDVGDAEDDPATWRKVHPHLGVTVREDFYPRELAKARRDGAEAMLAFRTKLLNLYTENELKAWISADLIRKHTAPVAVESYPDRPSAMVAIDLSVRDDFSAVTAGIYDTGGETPQFHYKTWYFFPRGAVAGHPNERLYRKWAEQGYLILLEGDVIDYEAIAQHIIDLDKHLYIIGIGYDSYKAPDCINILKATELAATVRPVRQSVGEFNKPVESFEAAIWTGGIVIDDNPINAYCFGNATLMTDGNENKKPVKRSRNHKIDGVITTLMCHKMYLESQQMAPAVFDEPIELG